MIVRLFHDLLPLARRPFAGSAVERVRGGQFAPDDKPHHIGVVQERVGLNNLMQPRAVEARLFDKTQVFYDRLFVGRSQTALLPVSLIEHELLIKGKPVEHDLVPLRSEIAESAIAAHSVDRPAAAIERKSKIVHGGVVRRPEIYLIVDAAALDKAFLFQRFPVHLRADGAHGLAAEFDFGQKFVLRAARKRRFEFEIEGILVGARRDLYRPDPTLGSGELHPDALPDSRRLHVPTAVVVIHPTLFPARLVDLGAVLRFDDEKILALFRTTAHVEREPRVPARMRSDEISVKPNLRGMIDAVEVEDTPLFELFPRENDLSRIPDVFAGFLFCDPARLALETERNSNPVLFFETAEKPFVLALVVPIECKIPIAVQAHPIFPHELRTGIVFQITFCVVHCFCNLLIIFVYGSVIAFVASVNVAQLLQSTPSWSAVSLYFSVLP